MKQLLFILLLLPVLAGGQIINRYAGNYSIGYSGDNGPATSASLYHPSGVFADHSGNLYFADFGNYVIRKVSVSGVISTIAGNGTAGFSGDGGPATAAKMHPTGVSVDAAGNVYVADGFNNVIRKINTSGIITTVAGNLTTGYSGDGGPATAAQLEDPNDVLVDSSGNLFISDSHNNVIRKVTASGIISTFAGNGYNAGTTYGGYSGDGGPATSAELFYPEHVAIDNAGNVYIAELYNNTIRMVNTSGIISTIAGTNVAGYSGDEGPATQAKLGHPYSVAVDNAGNIYIADESNFVVRKIDNAGIIRTYAGSNISGSSGDGGPATAAECNTAVSVAVDQSGNLYISDFYNNVIRVVGNAVTYVRPVAAYGSLEFNIYPNPASEQLTIASTDNITSIAITNLLGQTVYRRRYNSSKVQLDVADLPAGVYLIRINGTEVRKFVKQ
jgi:trimeric autotransporter adhesin